MMLIYRAVYHHQVSAVPQPGCGAVWAAEAFGLGWTTSMVAATPFFSGYVSETLFSLYFIRK